MFTTVTLTLLLALNPPVREVTWEESFMLYDEPVSLQSLLDEEAKAFQLPEEAVEEHLVQQTGVFVPLEIEEFYQERDERAPTNRERQRWADFVRMQALTVFSTEERIRIVVPEDEPRLARFAGEFVIVYFYHLPDFDDRVLELAEHDQFNPEVMLHPWLIPADAWDKAEPLSVSNFAASLEFVVREFVERTSPSEVIAAMREQEALNQMKMAGTAMIILVVDHEDKFPNDMLLEGDPRILPYTRNDATWESLNPNGGKIHFNLALRGRSLNDINEVTRTPMLYDSTPWPDGSRIVVFADSSVRRVSADDWPAVRARILAPGDV